MSESTPICSLLDGYMIGEPISEHNGIQCCPALNSITNDRYFLKIITFPPSQTQLDALYLTGALKDEDDAAKYYEERAKDLIREIDILQSLSRQEGFLPYEGYQAVPSKDGIGQKVYILSSYKRSLLRQFSKKPLTHLDALNLSLDICSALTACRRSGYLFSNLKPSNIFITPNGEYQISDLGFLRLDSLKYAAIAEHCISSYTAPEISDAYSSINDTLDVYAMGMILYEIFNGGKLPEDRSSMLSAPEYADEELSVIILKACSLDPTDRWSDPAQMGQALVSYMQKNGAHNTPIVPPLPEPEPVPDVSNDSNEELESIPEQLPDAELSFVDTSESPSESEEESNDQRESIAEQVQDAELIFTEVSDPISVDSSSENDEEISIDRDISDTSINGFHLNDIPICQDIVDEAAVIESYSQDEELFLNSDKTNDNANIAPSLAETDLAETSESSFEAEINIVESDNIPDHTESNEFSSDDAANNEQIIQEILQNHEAFNNEAAEIKAAAVYLDIEHTNDPSENISYDDITEEAIEILSQADALSAIEVPEPVVAPEAVVITLPETETESDDAEIQPTEEEIDMKAKNIHNSENIPEEKTLRSPHWIRNLVIILILLLLLAGGFLFYRFFMLQTIDQLDLQGTKDNLIVQIKSDADESLLSVSCEEKYGKTIIVPVNHGVAEFTGLKPDMEYTIRVDIAGMHILNGETAETYYTPKETTLVNYTVNTGELLGTADLSFVVEGPDSERWSLTYSTPGYPEVKQSFNGTSVLLSDLLPNKVYTGVLEPESDLFITEPFKIEFTATEVIQAHNLEITSCSGGKLSAKWDAPTSIDVENWIVRCYSAHDNGASYDQTVTTNMTSYEFKGLNSANGFFVEVTAEGQTKVQSESIGPNSVTVTNLNADVSMAGIISLTWQSTASPSNGWVVSYTVNGSQSVIKAVATEKTIVIDPVVPNAQYEITVQSGDSVHTFCESVSCTTKATNDFALSVNDKIITAKDMEFSLIKQPDISDWSYVDLTNSDYTNVYKKDEKAGFVIFLKKEFEESNADFNATFVISNDKGEIISITSREAVWNSIWNGNNCIFKIPALPEEAGYYTITLYLNSQFAEEQSFTIE